MPKAWSNSIYDVTVELPAQQDGNSLAVQQAAVMQVIARLTGQPELRDGRLLKLTDNAPQWVASWGFDSEINEASRMATLKIDPGLGRELSLLDVPLWTQPRPAQWLWLLVDEGQGRQPLSKTASPELWQALQQQAQYWQLPLAEPQWDEQDRSLVNFSELWGLFMDGVQQAATRYSPSYTAGRVLKVGEQWQLSIKTHDERRLNQSYPSAQALARDLFSFWVAPLVAKYAIAGQGQADVAVYGLNPASYAQLIKWLRDLDGVDRAWPVYSDDTRTLIRLSTGARIEQLQALLLQQVKIELLEPGEDESLAVRWQP